MSWQTIKRLQEERGQTLADMKTILKTAEDEKRDLSTEEDQKFNDLNTRAEQQKSTIDRYEATHRLELDLRDRADRSKDQDEQRFGREDLNTPEQQADEQAKEQRQQFGRFLRGTSPSELRALTVSGTGVVGDRTVYDNLVKTLKTFAGVREAGAMILPTSDGNDLDVPTADDTSNEGQIVGEAQTDNTEADPDLGTVTLKAHKFDSKWIKVSIEMLQDAAYPLESYILGIAGERIGRSFNKYATVGTGTGQPKGILTAATLGKTAASTSAIAYEELLDLVHSVDAGYRNSGSFRLMFHDTTLAAIRKLKDGSGRYLFAAGAAGAPSTVLDYRYVVNNAMPELSDGAGSKVIAAGDFNRYFVRDVTGVIVRRADELFIGDGLIGFRVFSRHDGQLTDTNAVKSLALAAS
ncbi:MAG: phage major capsid protein [Planctomycetota bacterium]